MGFANLSSNGMRGDSRASPEYMTLDNALLC